MATDISAYSVAKARAGGARRGAGVRRGWGGGGEGDPGGAWSCLSVSHGACVAPIVVLLGAFCVVSEQHIFGDTDTFPFSPSLSLVDPAFGRRCHVL